MNAEIAEGLLRVCGFGPLLFAGLMMLLDPKSVLDLFGVLQDGIHRFQGSLTHRHWFEPHRRRGVISHSGSARAFIRSAGVFLTVYALAGVAGFVL